MATTTMHNLRKPRLPLTSLPLLALIFSTFLAQTHAQTTTTQPPSSTLASGASAQTSNPGYANTTGNTSSNIGNYYFLIIGVFVIVLIAAYFLIARRRRVRQLQHRAATGEAAPERTGMRWPDRWRIVPLEPRIEEGLDERGEAPPPYMPGQAPPPAHIEGQPLAPGQAIPLQDYPGKPPDYDELTSSQEDLNLTRPSPAHAPSDRFGTMRRDGTRSPGPPTMTESSEMRSMDNPESNPTVEGIETPAIETSMEHHSTTSPEVTTTHPESRPTSPIA
ncbi:MAG: hypothetical protein MMC33_008728 [Icmadophila ericetorum]|nr:hypothetical protein [Icmadophila ericetorum]